jgi:hypothetical protein
LDVGGDDVGVLVGVVHLRATPLHRVVQLQRRIAIMKLMNTYPKIILRLFQTNQY